MESTPPGQVASLAEAIRSRLSTAPQSINQQTADEIASASIFPQIAAIRVQSWSPLLAIPYDILDHIIQHLIVHGRSHLLTLCQVSKRLYLACVPQIYRSIPIDFSDSVSTVLIYRLSDKSSRLPTYVRSLELRKCHYATMLDWTKVTEALLLFTTFHTFSWDTHADLPESVLSALSLRHPAAKLNARVRQLYAGNPPHDRVSQKRILTSSALGRLTRLEICLVNSASLNNNFKSDLLVLLSKSPNLKDFRLKCNPVQGDFPEMLDSCQDICFPRLHTLCLATKTFVFTKGELELWGRQGAWTELHYLTVSRATDIIPFVCRVPVLTHLELTATNGDGLPELRTRLQGCQCNSLGPVQSLVYRHFITTTQTSPAILEHIMPWPIISKISKTLIRYNSRHHPYALTSPTIATPTLIDLRRFRSSAPGITNLILDICLQKEVWPLPILKEFSCFRNVKNLQLFVHPFLEIDTQTRMRNGVYIERTGSELLAYLQAFKIITNAGENLPVNPDFVVGFTRVQSYYELTRPRHEADFTVTFNSMGKVTHTRYIHKAIDTSISRRMQTASETLQELEYKERIHRPVVIDYQTIGRGFLTDPNGKLWWILRCEIRRRERQMQLGVRYGDALFTLYDC